jgi:hypothetical protein
LLNLIVITVFLFSVCASLYLLYRRGDLRRFASLPGETVICDERDIGISLTHANGDRYSELTYRSERAGDYTRVFVVR